MFRKSRIKIIAAIMAVLVLLLAGTLGIIYGSSYYEVRRENYQMLARYAGAYTLNSSQQQTGAAAEQSQTATTGSAPAKPEKNGAMQLGQPGSEPDPKQPPGDDHKFEISTFYAVALSETGTALEVQNNSGSLYSNSELTDIAQQIVAGKKTQGVTGNLAFLKTQKQNYTLIAFIDNTVLSGNIATLFQSTLIFGAVSILAVFAAAVFLAKKIVSPLEESYQTQRRFISDAGHELKTPVAVVNANAELLAREVGPNRWLENIQYENERMNLLVKQLLELARTESVTPQMQRLNFSRLVNGEVLPFESVAFEQQTELKYSIEPDLFVAGDENRLKQLTAILLDNALSHNQNNAPIKLQLTAERGFARLSVSNAGGPIAEKEREQLFERFYRADPARTGKEGHFGLGLAIAKAIVTAHHGKIGVTCQNQRVTFTLRLPLQK